MAQQYPIWHDVSACHYKKNPSWGGKDNSKDTIYIGSSKQNSYQFAEILTTRRFENGKVIYRISIDGVILKEAIFKDNNGRAGKFLKIRSKLKSIKSLKSIIK